MLTGSSATFDWSAGSGVTEYEIRIGTTVAGSEDVFRLTTTALTSGVVSNIPTYGVKLYVRLYSLINKAWQYKDYTVTESGSPVLAALSSPTPGSTLTGSSATFGWTAGGGVTLYEIRVGTTGAGSKDLLVLFTTALSSGVVNSIPTTGGKLYVRLYSEINGVWQYKDYTYTEQ
jgi:Na+/H+ antiporter NhaD/arsenite permease-like protein